MGDAPRSPTSNDSSGENLRGYNWIKFGLHFEAFPVRKSYDDTEQYTMAPEALIETNNADLFPRGGWDTHHHIFERM